MEVAHTGTEALRAVQAFRPHLVVLDVMLPDLDGFTVLERMGQERRSADIPVLFLTARGDLDDRLRGLALGGDDYMTKPFSVEEMLLRINAILRRAEGYEEIGPRLVVADVELDEESHEVRRGGVAVELTPTEFRLLHYLMMNAGQVVSKAQIRDRVWDYSFDGKVNMVEVYVSYLRKKLDAHGPPLIRTVRGIGYSMRTSRCPTAGPDHPDHPDESTDTRPQPERPGPAVGAAGDPAPPPAPAAGGDRGRRPGHLRRGDLQRPAVVPHHAGRPAAGGGGLSCGPGPPLLLGARAPGARGPAHVPASPMARTRSGRPGPSATEAVCSSSGRGTDSRRARPARHLRSAPQHARARSKPTCSSTTAARLPGPRSSRPSCPGQRPARRHGPLLHHLQLGLQARCPTGPWPSLWPTGPG